VNVNVVFIGHVDHGKSTLIGRLLYDSDSITEGRVAEIQKLAEEYKRRFEFAYFIDSFDDELKEERTIDTTGVMFKGKNLYTITDVPGHKEFIKNMLTGASRADVAVLVVAADEGVQEQTRRHAFLVHMLGIRKLIVVANKMDTVDFSRGVFESVQNDVVGLLASFGLQAMEFIPCSAMEGDNIYQKSERIPWYHGRTLIEALDRVELDWKPQVLRFVVQDTYSVDSDSIIVGRVESGTLQKGDEVIFHPSGVKGRIENIRTLDCELDLAERGDAVGIITDCNPRRGDVGGLADNPPIAIESFLGEAVLLDGNLRRWEEIGLRCGTRRVNCYIKEIQAKINSETGAITERYPETIDEHDGATILFATEPLVVEKFNDIPELGRFVMVRDKNIGAGIVLETQK
jgi:small GTP-binding protein